MCRRTLSALGEEPRQAQQPVLVVGAGRRRDGAARLGRHVDEVVVAARRGTCGKVEAEAELIEQHQLPAHHQRRPHLRLVEVAEHEQRHLEQRWMWIALRQQTRQPAQRRETGQRQRIVHRLRGIAFAQLDVDVAELLGEPRLPRCVDVIAGLEDRAQLARAPAMHEAEVAAVRAREDFRHGSRLAVRLHRQDDALIGPLHCVSLYRLFQRHRP